MQKQGDPVERYEERVSRQAGAVLVHSPFNRAELYMAVSKIAESTTLRGSVLSKVQLEPRPKVLNMPRST